MTTHTLLVTLPLRLQGTDPGSPAWLSCGTSKSDPELKKGQFFHHIWKVGKQKFSSLMMVVDIDIEIRQLADGSIVRKVNYILEMAEREQFPKLEKAWKLLKPHWFE